MNRPLVGILGAYGTVGRAVVAILQDQSNMLRLRLGGRRAELLAELVANRPGDEFCVVDIFEPEMLARMCFGCSIVINCAGPAHRIFDLVGCAALAAGADYVDPAGDALLLTRMTELTTAMHGRRVLLSAGMLPGLSGILPRWLARGIAPGASLSAHIGVLNPFSASGAEDFLAGLGRNESLAAWRNGKRMAGALTRATGIDVPFFPVGLTVHPYLNGESESLAEALGLVQAYFYNVFDGEHILSVLARVVGRALDSALLGLEGQELARASVLDVAGRTPYVIFLFQLDGVSEDGACTRILMMRALSAAVITGAVAALSAQALLADEVPYGTNYAAEILDPDKAVQRLLDGNVVLSWLVKEYAPHQAAIEEGVL